jgi:putative glutamine amidotransferase
MSDPATSQSPVIGITADISNVQANGTKRQQEPALFLPRRYCRAIHKSGGMPLIIPPVIFRSALRKMLQRLDGILISGGNFDIHPSFYGEEPIAALGTINQERTEFELELINEALKCDMPLLGVCGGAQAINVALGGSLYQDIATQLPHAEEHEQGKKPQSGHSIKIHDGTRLRRIVRTQALKVNTTHHQAVKTLGKGLVVNATARDGLIEGIESPSHEFVLGVQWHPEALALKDPHQRRIFSTFISVSKHLHK